MVRVWLPTEETFAVRGSARATEPTEPSLVCAQGSEHTRA